MTRETCKVCGREFMLDDIRRKLPAPPPLPFPICFACECRAFDLGCLGGAEGLKELVEYVVRESRFLKQARP